MLSRVADSLYWIGRYTERSENLARLLEVNNQLMLDAASGSEIQEQWEPIVFATGDKPLFEKLYDTYNAENVTNFLTFDRDNPTSILSTISAARENARMIRDQISGEMWESINRLYLFMQSADADNAWKQGAHEFYARIKDSSLLFQGLAESTFPHEEGYTFIQVGKFLERADKTSRILDIKYHVLLPSGGDVGGAVDIAQWVAILRSCSGLEAYHADYITDVMPWKVAEFLILSNRFPRSIRFCIGSLNYNLRRITGTNDGFFSNEAERLSGKLMADLNYSTIDDIIQYGMHEYLDGLQIRFNDIGKAVFEAYMFQPPVDMAAEIQQQQQQ